MSNDKMFSSITLKRGNLRRRQIVAFVRIDFIFPLFSSDSFPTLANKSSVVHLISDKTITFL